MFTERLEVTIHVTVEGTVWVIPGGAVERVELDLCSYGWSGELEFWVAEDKNVGGREEERLLAAFTRPDLMEVSLSLRAVHESPEVTEPPEALAVRGLVVEKSLRERTFPGIDGTPVLYRGYRVRCRDAASVLWRQHFPCALYTATTLRAVIDAERGPRITVDYQWPALEAERPLVFLGLDPTAQAASFYDFVLWTVDAQGGVWTHDYGTHAIRLSAEKDTTDAPAALPRADVQEVTVHFPEVARHAVTVRNTGALAARSEPLPGPSAVEGVRHDVLMRTSLAKAVEDRVALEKRRLKLRGPELELRFARMPSVTLRPGGRLGFDGAWSTTSQDAARTWRVWRVTLSARSARHGPDADHLAPSAHYDIELLARLETEDEPSVQLPDFVRPRYPHLVEGLVVSTEGEDGEETSQVTTDEQTSREDIEVRLPVFDDQTVRVPFSPWHTTGHLYLPAWKGARVLVALDVDSASFAGFLDWKVGARLPADGQGAGMVLGKSPSDRTALTHTYDGDVPVFRVVRTHATDSVSVTMAEGSLRIEVREDAGEEP